MKFTSVLVLITFLSSWAIAQNDIDNSVFNGKFIMDHEKSTENCRLNDFGPMEFVRDGANHTVKFVSLNDNNRYYSIDRINTGKRTFNSCWSDGLVGYAETTLRKNKIEDKTTYLKPGFVCRGGGVKEVVLYTWEIRRNIFAQSKNGKPICIYNRM